MHINSKHRPASATHWDSEVKVFCTEHGFWFKDRWHPCKSSGWGTERYVKLDAIQPTSAKDGTTNPGD